MYAHMVRGKFLVTTPTNYVDKANIFYVRTIVLVHLTFGHTQLNHSVNFDINKRRTIARVATGGGGGVC